VLRKICVGNLILKFHIFKVITFIICINIHCDIQSGGLGIKIISGETENSAQFWANNKMFINYRPKCIQAAQILARSGRGSPTHHPTEPAPRHPLKCN